MYGKKSRKIKGFIALFALAKYIIISTGEDKMSYVRTICRAGKTKEYGFYFSRKYHDKNKSPEKEKRAEKEKETSEAQKKVNLRQLERKLTRIMNENFSGKDKYVTWSFQKEKRPKTKEELKEIIQKLLRKIRAVYKKEKLVFKYIWVAERGEKGATHIHMVMNNICMDKIIKLWDYGWITIKPLDSSGQYRKLAGYFIKYSSKTLKTEKELQGKRYNCSKNLKRPQMDVKPILKRNTFKTDIKVPKGWYLDKESVRQGIHEITGYEFLFYTLIKCEKAEKD